MRNRLFGYTVVVKKHLELPIDMLRYDSAWPEGTADATKIRLSIEGRATGDFGPRAIRLLSIQKPTVGRWESFGCRVIESDDDRREDVIAELLEAGAKLGKPVRS